MLNYIKAKKLRNIFTYVYLNFLPSRSNCSPGGGSGINRCVCFGAFTCIR